MVRLMLAHLHRESIDSDALGHSSNLRLMCQICIQICLHVHDVSELVMGSKPAARLHQLCIWVSRLLLIHLWATTNTVLSL